MKSNIIVIVLILALFTSCGKTVYYAYDEDGSREDYPEGYCTFEIKKKKIIYRGYSKIYEEYTPYGPSFIYILGERRSLPAVYIDPQELQTKYLPLDSKQGFISSNTDNTISIYYASLDDSGGLYYDLTANADSIVRTYNSEIKFDGIGAISWFPPYAKRIKKIDYTQFEKRAKQGINYKNPIKTTGDWGWPTEYVDKMPRFKNALPGEYHLYEFDRFKNWVMSQLVYPEEVIRKGAKGWINIGIIIEKDGSVNQNAALTTSANYNLHEIHKQIAEIIKSSPKWTPAKKAKQHVRMRNTTQYTFDIPPADPAYLDEYEKTNPWK